MTDREPIGVIGVGWVGAVTAACFAELGHEVWARDIVPEKVESLSRGELPIHEPGLSELITKNAERLHFTTDMQEVLDHAQLLFVCVDTPPTYSGDADLSRVDAVIAELGDSDEHALVMKSTVPVGTGRSIQRRREGIGYVSNPEFLKEGSAVADFMNPDRVVVGANGGSEQYADRVEALYAPLGAEVVRTDVASAEMIKLASNAFLATKISFINEIANVSEELGADVREVSRGMGLDDRIGPKFLQAGVGFGGSCFPKDVQALKQLAGNTGYHFQLLTAVVEVNELQKRRTISKLQKHLGSLAGKEVALLGVAFKPDTDDIREATSLVLAGRLAGEGANVRVFDPVVGAKAEDMLSGARITESALEAIDGADAVVLVTEWPEFRELDWTGEVKRRMRIPAGGGRPQLPGPRAARGGRFHLRGNRQVAVQALVLAGGEGTRLRPLTLTTPKPVMPLAGRPFLSFMLDWVHSHGADEVILSCGFMSDAVKAVLGDIYDGMRLRHVIEDEPLGTAGPVRLAYDEGLLEERFLVLNGDVLTDIDLTAELEQHERTGARTTLALYPVEDTSSYGVVPTDDDGQVTEFIEKGSGEAPTDRINAGAYVLERDVVESIPAGRAVSFETEVFPSLIGGGLYGYDAAGYWIDIGTPERYLEATWDLLAGRVHSTLPPRDETGSLIYPHCLVSGAHVGPQTVLGRHCSVGTDARVERSVLHERVLVGADAAVIESVLGERVRVGERARVGPDAMVGANAVIEADAVVPSGARVEPGATVSAASGVS